MSSSGALKFPTRAQPASGPELAQMQPVLATATVTTSHRRLALGVLVLSAVVFVALAPFAKTQLPAVPAFLPIYQSALVIIDLIAAVLLFGQFGILRSRALLVLASAYLFSAAMAIAHLLSFPGLFAPRRWLGAGPQTTAWLYFLWHGGFPLLVIPYSVLKGGSPARAHAGRQTCAGATILMSVFRVPAGVYGLGFLTTSMYGQLPQ